MRNTERFMEREIASVMEGNWKACIGRKSFSESTTTTKGKTEEKYTEQRERFPTPPNTHTVSSTHLVPHRNNFAYLETYKQEGTGKSSSRKDKQILMEWKQS